MAHRQQLEEMAATWEQPAIAEQNKIDERPDFDEDGYVIEVEIIPDDNSNPKKH